MKALILGSGLQGITTAYVLASRGHEVHVIERHHESAAETSFANGAQLSYSHAEPWANPDTFRHLPKWMLHEDSPLIFRPGALAGSCLWGLKFLSACRRTAAERNCINMLRLGLYSRAKMSQLRQETNLEFDFAAEGILHIFSTEKALEHAYKQSEFQAQFGCNEQLLSREECLNMEPTLTHAEIPIVGGIFAPDDETGDAQMFCMHMADYITTHFNAHVHYQHTVEQLEHDGENITGLVTDKGKYQADYYIIAMGAYSPLLTKKLGFRLPIYPMKGYSLTIEANEHCPNMSITDSAAKIVCTRIGDRMRIAGTAELAGYDTTVNAARIAPIAAEAKKLFPGADWDNRIHEWACLRPSTPDGPPLLGQTPYKNLLLNTCHGTLGWTQAPGSAYI